VCCTPEPAPDARVDRGDAVDGERDTTLGTAEAGADAAGRWIDNPSRDERAWCAVLPAPPLLLPGGLLICARGEIPAPAKSSSSSDADDVASAASARSAIG
jgi:hypothetical protein